MTTYAGSCHCGKVSYEVDVDLSKPSITCNCSICQRTGTVLTFVAPEQFKLKSGAEALTDYKFGRMNINHKFCSTCGVKSFATGKRRDGSDVVAVNVRCLENIELEKVPTKQVDGRSVPI